MIQANSGPAAPSINDEKLEESKEEIKLLTKDESKNVMKTKEFENFINKTSKIIERALTTNIDVLGAFFDDG